MRIKMRQVYTLALLSLIFFNFQNCSQSSVITVSPIAKGVLNSIQPALAVRGMACITCHTQSSSNVVTDYGFGNSWYFDTVSSDSFYADRTAAASGIDTLSLGAGKVIVVPKADAPASIQTMFNVTTLADFIRARFAQDSTNSPEQVVEVDKLQITIPTTDRIQGIFDPGTNPNARFVPDSPSSPTFAGLNYDAVNGVFVIRNLVCDGDLYLAKPVIFDSASVQSVGGCRIYATNSVFIQGILTSIAYGTSTTFNTQILSTESIWVGAGRMIKDGAFCEVDANGNPSGWYSVVADAGLDCTNAANAGTIQCDTLATRANDMVGRNTFSRAYPDVASVTGFMNFTAQRAGGTLATEAAKMEAAVGHPLYDASCVGGRGSKQERLMLISPYVNDRYNGDFSGSVIAEAALMSLGSFIFQFDPVFTKVSIFSQLKEGELISGATVSANPISGNAGSSSSSSSSSN